jgi:trehalose 2-sulfotransferase
VSWLRAEQTGVWFQTIQSERAWPAREPHFDLDEVQRLVHLIGAHNAAWRECFDSAGIQPHPVRYAELAAGPAGVARDVLSFLGLELPAGREIRAQHERLADGLNAHWIQRYRAEVG